MYGDFRCNVHVVYVLYSIMIYFVKILAREMDDIVAYRDHWQAVAEIERQELRSASANIAGSN